MKKSTPQSLLKNFEIGLGIAALISIAALLICYCLIQITDLDFWLHLKSGEIILKNLSVPQVDPFSFTFSGRAWIDHSWLFQVIIYSLKNTAGFNGVSAFQALVFTLTFLCFIFSLYRKKEDLLPIALFGLLLVLIFSSRVTLRPDILSIFFLSFFYLAFTRFRNSRWLYLLIPVQIIWVNSHGYFFLGLLLMVVIWLEEALKQKNKQKDALGLIEYGRFKYIFIALAACLFLNPYGYRLVLYPFNAAFQAFSGHKDIIFFVQELRPGLEKSTLLDFSSRPIFKTVIILTLCTFLLHWRNLKKTNLLLWLIFFGLTLRGMRHIPYFAFISCILSADLFCEYSNIFSNRFKQVSEKGLPLRIIMILSIIAISVYEFNNFIGKESFDFQKQQFKGVLGGISPYLYPSKASEFVLKNNLPERLGNDFNSGAYLIGRFYPKRKVFIDGRTEFYPADFLDDYRKMMSGEKKFLNELADKYDLQGFFLSFTYSDISLDLLKLLYKTEDWKLVYFDEQAAIFLKQCKGNQALIDKFLVDLNDWHPPAWDPDIALTKKEKVYPLPYLSRGAMLMEIGLYDQAIQELSVAVEIDPSLAKSFSMRAEAQFLKGNYRRAIKDFNAAISLKPKDAYAINNLGAVYLEKGDIDPALHCFQKAVSINRNFGKAYYNLYTVFAKRKDNKKAIEYLKKATEASAGNIKYLNLLGHSYYQNYDIAAALKTYERIIHLKTQDAQAFTHKGVCLSILGLFDEAQKAFFKAIEIDPEFSDPYFNFANSLASQGRYEEALVNFKKSGALGFNHEIISRNINEIKAMIKKN